MIGGEREGLHRSGALGVVPGGDEFERCLGVGERDREITVARERIDEALELAGVLRARRREIGPHLLGLLGEGRPPELEVPRSGAGSYASLDDVIVTLSKCHTSCDDSLAAPSVTFIVINAPSAVRPIATAQSSVSTSFTRVVAIARSSTIGPAIHVSMSWLWIAWLSTQPAALARPRAAPRRLGVVALAASPPGRRRRGEEIGR